MGYRNIKKQINLFLFFKLWIFIFQSPGTTHITNFTRMPLLVVVVEEAVEWRVQPVCQL